MAKLGFQIDITCILRKKLLRLFSYWNVVFYLILFANPIFASQIETKAYNDKGFGSLIDPNQQPRSIVMQLPVKSGSKPAKTVLAEPDNQTIDMAEVPDEMSCNLFENPEFSSVMEALNSLKSSIQSAQNCKEEDGSSPIKEVEKSRSQIEASLKDINSYFEKAKQGEQITPIMAEKISVTISDTVNSSAEIAGIFSKNYECTKEKSPNVALAVNNLLNGLTPFAAMAASAAGVTVSSSAAFPLLAGTAITSTVSSINDIITADSIKIDNPIVRRAIFQNTCQLLKLEKKKAIFMNETSENDHLIASIDEASKSLNNEARRFYALKMEALGELNQDFVTITNLLDTSVKLQIDVSKYFEFYDSSPSSKDKCFIAQEILQFQIAEKTFENLSSAMSYIDENSDNYNLLKISGQRQITTHEAKKIELSKFGTTTSNPRRNQNQVMDYSICANDVQAWLRATLEAAKIATQILQGEKDILDNQIQSNKEYMGYVNNSRHIKFRASVAKGIISAVDEIKKSNAFNKTELYNDLEKLRNTLFYKGSNRFGLPIDSPVTSWLNFHIEEHRRLLENFYYGYHKLVMMSSPFTPFNPKLDLYLEGLRPEYFNHSSSKFSGEQVCNELKNVRAKWYESEAYLLSAKRFCNMILNHINLTSKGDEPVVKLCKGSPLMIKAAVAGSNRPNLIYTGVRLFDKGGPAQIDFLIEELQKPTSNIILFLDHIQNKLEMFGCSLSQ
jgi:hypothetical protein